MAGLIKINNNNNNNSNNNNNHKNYNVTDGFLFNRENLLNGLEKYKKNPSFVYSYGTAGFRFQ